MAKKRTDNESKAEAAAAQDVAQRGWRLKGGALSAAHPFLGVVTKDHIEGPKGETFIRAIKALDEKNGSDWYGKHIEAMD